MDLYAVVIWPLSSRAVKAMRIGPCTLVSRQPFKPFVVNLWSSHDALVSHSFGGHAKTSDIIVLLVVVRVEPRVAQAVAENFFRRDLARFTRVVRLILTHVHRLVDDARDQFHRDHRRRVRQVILFDDLVELAPALLRAHDLFDARLFVRNLGLALLLRQVVIRVQCERAIRSDDDVSREPPLEPFRVRERVRHLKRAGGVRVEPAHARHVRLRARLERVPLRPRVEPRVRVPVRVGRIVLAHHDERVRYRGSDAAVSLSLVEIVTQRAVDALIAHVRRSRDLALNDLHDRLAEEHELGRDVDLDDFLLRGRGHAHAAAVVFLSVREIRAVAARGVRVEDFLSRRFVFVLVPAQNLVDQRALRVGKLRKRLGPDEREPEVRVHHRRARVDHDDDSRRDQARRVPGRDFNLRVRLALGVRHDFVRDVDRLRLLHPRLGVFRGDRHRRGRARIFELDALLDVRQRLNVPERVRGVHARELPVAVLAEWHLDVKRGRDFRRPRVRLLLRQPRVEADRVPGRVAATCKS
eukprot:16644-Pelagococcus_subviridis.AAC.3